MTQRPILNAALFTMLANSPDLIFIKDTELKYVAASPPFLRAVGLAHTDQIMGKTDFELFPDEGLAFRYVSDDWSLLSGGHDLTDYIESLGEVDGQARFGSTSKHILRNPSGEIIGLLGITRDITQEYLSRLHHQQELKYLFELPRDAYAATYLDIDTWRLVNQRLQTVNDAAMEVCSTVDELLEAAQASIPDHSCDAAQFFHRFSQVYLQNIYASGQRHLEFEYQRRLSDQSCHWVESELRFLPDPESHHLCVILITRDIDERKQKELSATLDKMTSLLNRETTETCIREILAEAPQENHALFMLDADNFKALNDTLGHQAGDDFLIAMAKATKDTFRARDVVGRIGGDEFFAFLRGARSPAEAKVKARALLSAIQAVCANYPTVALSCSIGVSLYPQHGSNLEELYAQADAALYQAKRSGKNQIVFAP